MLNINEMILSCVEFVIIPVYNVKNLYLDREKHNQY